MRGEAVGQRFPALEQANDVEHDGAEGARSVSSAVIESARSTGTPAFSSVESSCVKKRTSLRWPALKAGSLI